MNSNPFTLLPSPPPDLGPGPRAGVEPLGSLQTAIDDALRKTPLPTAQASAARALILLWHDHHDPAHAIVQDMSTQEASYVHAILHRREPDFSNAKYWFHRVGSHPCYQPLAQAAASVLKNSSNHTLQSQLIPAGKWDPIAFVDACQTAMQRPVDAKPVESFREIQAAEFRLLLESLTAR
jgi:hypothetical protein